MTAEPMTHKQAVEVATGWAVEARRVERLRVRAGLGLVVVELLVLVGLAARFGGGRGVISAGVFAVLVGVGLVGWVRLAERPNNNDGGMT